MFKRSLFNTTILNVVVVGLVLLFVNMSAATSPARIEDHFYTTSAAERDNAAAHEGYVFERVCCYVSTTQTPGTVPLYRLLQPQSGDHLYTTSAAERDNATAHLGYRTEGVCCYVAIAQAPGTVPLYRLINRGSGSHFYTTSSAERDAAVANAGYQAEGICCNVSDSAAPGTTQLFRLRANIISAHEKTLFDWNGDVTRMMDITKYMETWTTLYPDGSLESKTHIWTTSELSGFEGAVNIQCLDADGRIVAVTPYRQFGVDGTLIQNLPIVATDSSREITYTDHCPSNITRYLTIYQRFGKKGIDWERTVLATVINPGATISSVSGWELLIILDNHLPKPTPDSKATSSSPSQSKGSPGEVSKIYQGEQLTPGTLVKGTTPEVYFIHEGRRHWIPSPAVFNAWHFNWDRVHTFPDDLIVKIPKGPDLPPTPVQARVPPQAANKIADHFYTISEAERDNAAAHVGYHVEGVCCYVSTAQAPGMVPLYRLLQPQSGDHFYTTSVAERDNATGHLGYQAEGVCCYVSTAQAPGTVPLYRLVNRGSGDHFYTTSAPERDAAVASAGYQAEGVCCYVSSSPASGTTPLFRLYSGPAPGMSPAERNRR